MSHRVGGQEFASKWLADYVAPNFEYAKATSLVSHQANHVLDPTLRSEAVHNHPQTLAHLDANTSCRAFAYLKP